MRSLPRSAQFYICFIYLCGVVAAVCAYVLPAPRSLGLPWEIAMFLVIGTLADGTKVRLMRTRGADDHGSMSLSFALTFAAMLRFGPLAAVAVGAVSSFVGGIFPKRQPTYQMLFNVAASIVETFISSQIFVLINAGNLELKMATSFPAVAASTLSYFFINTGTIATIIGLCTKEHIFRLWRRTFLWTAPSYFAGSCVSTLALIIFARNLGGLVLFASPVAILMYHFYSVNSARTEEKQQHIEELQMNQARLADLYLATIKSLALAIDAKDQYTHQHILRVQTFAVATAKKMGLSGDELKGLEFGALLHDIGKLGVPEYVLLKPGRLTDEEFAKIKEHPRIGADILSPVPFPWPVLPGVKYHHEKWDGSGYPEGLKGEEIPLPGRILAVADVYDALTSSRSYRTAWTHERAVALIKRDAGTHFDPMIVEAFLSVIDDVVAEMATQGIGPLASQSAAASSGSKPNGSSEAERAVRDIQRASSELWALYEVAQTLSSSLGMQETLDILARKLDAILPGTACLFLLRDEREEARAMPRLAVHAAVGINREFFENAHTVGAMSASLRVTSSRETYDGPYDADDLLITSGSQHVQWVELNSALIVPIVHQGVVLGTINLYHPMPNAFGSHDRQLLEMIAERAALALYNGILFDRTRSHAHTDPLTGLYNVRYLTQQVEERCHRWARQPAISAARIGDTAILRRDDSFALLCLDLDSFKPINDNFGHQKGDQVLRDLARLFRSTVREDDIVARYGGDEFLIVLSGAGKSEAESMAARLQAAVEQYDPGLTHPKLGELRLGVSIGWACFPGDGSDCATLLSNADSRMYHDKTERKLGNLVSAGHSAEPARPGLPAPEEDYRHSNSPDDSPQHEKRRRAA